MDPLGHASIGLIVKPLAPKAPLWALLTATAVPDLLFFGFQAAGLEYQAVTQFDVNSGLQYLSLPLIPWSHGLVMGIIWSAMVTVIAFLFSRDRRTSIVIGLMVFSHWVLDASMYPIMPVFFDNSKMIGLGLMTSGPGFIASAILEISLLTAGIATYWITRKGRTA
jgi:membrane-bound metal-dependent hydrolase YbcI (DUF457 family)